jgi:hypothetical protein
MGIYKSTNAAATGRHQYVTSRPSFKVKRYINRQEFMIGGTQDNGTEFKRADGTWTRADFGDGGFALIDQSAADTNVTMYHTYFNQTNNGINGSGKLCLCNGRRVVLQRI